MNPVELNPIECASEAETEQLAETVALALKPGDLVALVGDLGAGKTTFARALIRAASGNPLMEVPSPTFTLVQSYPDLPFGNLAHADLYRIESPDEVGELGLEEALANGVVLVEWPERGAGALPQEALALTFSQGNENDDRIVAIKGEQQTLDRVIRSLSIREFLNANGCSEAMRQHLTGDASTRAYETVHQQGKAIRVLMNAPEQADGAPIRDGKPYSQIAHLAENVRAFVGVNQMLRNKGFRAPEIHAHDLDAGLLLIEDFGRDSILTTAREPVRERYLVAAKTIANLHQQDWSFDETLPDGSVHTVPAFDHGAMRIETDLLPDWYAQHKLKRELSGQERKQFDAIWDALVARLDSAERSLVLRDFHSPNIIWINDAEGSDRVGLIDFQDALVGPTAYDVASLAQDARVDISEELEAAIVDQYCAARQNLDEPTFREAYAIMAAQRATKILGIFVRLSKRDGKHGYLAHLPRIETYLRRALAHPVLADYRNWVATVLEQ